MADAYKFQAYTGGAGNYFLVELDPNVKNVEILSEGFNLNDTGVTVEYQSKYKPTTNTWITITVPAGAEKHLVIADGAVARVRILHPTAGTYELCVFQ